MFVRNTSIVRRTTHDPDTPLFYSIYKSHVTWKGPHRSYIDWYLKALRSVLADHDRRHRFGIADRWDHES